MLDDGKLVARVSCLLPVCVCVCVSDGTISRKLLGRIISDEYLAQRTMNAVSSSPMLFQKVWAPAIKGPRKMLCKRKWLELPAQLEWNEIESGGSASDECKYLHLNWNGTRFSQTVNQCRVLNWRKSKADAVVSPMHQMIDSRSELNTIIKPEASHHSRS